MLRITARFHDSLVGFFGRFHHRCSAFRFSQWQVAIGSTCLNSTFKILETEFLPASAHGGQFRRPIVHGAQMARVAVMSRAWDVVDAVSRGQQIEAKGRVSGMILVRG